MVTGQTSAGRTAGEQLRETGALDPKQLVLALLASVIGTVLTGFFGAGRFGTLAGALVAPLASALITTHGRGAARSLGIALLAAIALFLTVTGFTISDVLRDGESPVADREGTFLPAPGSGSKSAGDTSGLSAPEDPVRCPETKVNGKADCRFGVKPASSATVQLYGAELGGRDKDDFAIVKECKGTLKPGTACSIRLRFSPSSEGERKAEVIVKLPGGTRVVQLRGKGIPGDEAGQGCAEGFVPRRATSNDSICVTPAERDRAAQQKQAHEDEGRAKEDGTCVDGFVWREAAENDHICVTPAERDDAAQQNRLHGERSTG